MPRTLLILDPNTTVQRVAKLKPDLIVAAADTDPVDVAQAARRSGATVYVQPSRTVEDVERAVIELGFLDGRGKLRGYDTKSLVTFD